MKRGVLPLKVIVMLVILMVFTVLFIIAFLTPDSLLNKAAAKSDLLLNYLPTSDVDVPNQQIEKDPVFTAKYDSLLNILQNADGPCVVEFDWPKEFNKYTYEFSRDGDKTLFTLRSNGAVIRDTLVKVEMCVVAGQLKNTDVLFEEDKPIAYVNRDGNVQPNNPLYNTHKDQLELDDVSIAAQNFYTNWIQEHPTTIPAIDLFKPYIDARKNNKKILSPDHTIVNKIVIGEEETMELNSQKVDREDGNLLYVPEEGKVCFFKTVKRNNGFGCDPGENGLDNDCFDDPEEDRIFDMPHC